MAVRSFLFDNLIVFELSIVAGIQPVFGIILTKVITVSSLFEN
jgi:hypothetical protein